LLMEGLNSKVSPEIRKLTLSALMQCSGNEKGISILNDQKLFELLIETIKTTETGIASNAAEIILKLCNFPLGLKLVFQINNISQLKKIASEKNGTIKFRALDLFASISSISQNTFHLCEENGMLDSIISSFQTDDILEQLNVIELLDKVILNQLTLIF